MIPRSKARLDGKWLALIALAASGSVLLSSCSKSSAPGASRGARAPIPVLAAKAESRDVPVQIPAVGNVAAYSTVSIRSQITDKIIGVGFQEGQAVRAGDPLFMLDPRPYQAALNQARANRVRDEAQMVSARLEFERTSNLFAGKIASRQDYDTAEANYGALKASIMADQAAISNAQVNLDYTTLSAPIDGRTGNLVVKKGNVVKSPDDVLLTLTQTRPIFVMFSVPEQFLPALRREAQRRALPVEARSPGETNSAARGELTFINNMVDTNTGMILLKGTFANADELLWPGQFVQVTLTLNTLEHATVVPSQAVQTGQDGEFVFVVRPDQSVEARPVTAGVSYDGMTVLTGGVRPGEDVVTDGQLRLTPGAKVQIKTSIAEAPASTLTADSLKK